jgi:parallel beta-helix repeat protein
MSRHSIWKAALLLGALLVFQPRMAFCTVYWVSAQSGNNSNAGTSEAQAWATIHYGISHTDALSQCDSMYEGDGTWCLQPGDTLMIKAGSYNEAGLDGLPGGSDWDNPVTIKAAPGSRPVFTPPSGARVINLSEDGDDVFDTAKEHFIIIDGLILDGVNVSNEVLKIAGDASDIRIQNSELRNAPAGSCILSGAPHATFQNLELHHCGNDGETHGIYLTSHHDVVDGCRVHDNSGYGIQFWTGTYGTIHDNIIRNNIAYDNREGCGIVFGGGPNNSAYNNIAYGNSGCGIYVDNGNSDGFVYHNVVYDNGDWGIRMGDYSATHQPANMWIVGNVSYNNASGPYHIGPYNTNPSYAANFPDPNP